MQALIPNICWICGGIANTGEHIIKASDLKLTVYNIKNNPESKDHFLISSNLNGHHDRKKALNGARDDAYKYKKNLCSVCNGNTSQRHDMAWSEYSSSFFEKKSFPPFTQINAYPIENEVAANICLYFAKAIGCKINQEGLNDKYNLKRLANAIKNRGPSYIPDNLYVSYYANYSKSWKFPKDLVFSGPAIYYEDFEDHFEFFYFVHELTVVVDYYIDGVSKNDHCDKNDGGLHHSNRNIPIYMSSFHNSQEKIFFYLKSWSLLTKTDGETWHDFLNAQIRYSENMSMLCFLKKETYKIFKQLYPNGNKNYDFFDERWPFPYRKIEFSRPHIYRYELISVLISCGFSSISETEFTFYKENN